MRLGPLLDDRSRRVVRGLRARVPALARGSGLARHPKGCPEQGGDVAAPLFARIATEAVRLLAIPPDDPTRNIRLVTYSPETLPKTTLRG